MFKKGKISTLVLFMLLLLLICKVGNAQYFRVEGSAYGGYVLPHDKAIAHLSRGVFPMYQLSISHRVSGMQPWHHLYDFPETGLGFFYVNPAYPEVLGHAFAVIPHIGLNLYQSSGLQFTLRHGLGLAWLTKAYNAYNNPLNTAIGSHLNIAVNLAAKLRWQLHESWHVHSGISIIHFSNGKLATPNKGINVPSVMLGVSYKVKQGDRAVRVENVSAATPLTALTVVAAGGVSASYPPGSGKSQRYAISGTYDRAVSPKHYLGLGYDFFFSYPENSTANNLHDDHSPFINHGLHLSFRQHFSRMSFILHNGIYFWDRKNVRETFYYHRAGLRYELPANILLNISLKSHLFRAEFIEWGIGYRII